MSPPLDSIDRTTRTIESAQWRMYCDNPANGSWKRYRAIVGVVDRQRMLTPYEALMVWAMRNWRVICHDLGRPFITLPSDLIEAEGIVNQWLQVAAEAHGVTAIEQIATLNEVEGRNFPALIKLLLGKQVSQSTLRRLGQMRGMPPYKLAARYSKAQVQLYLRKIASEC